MKTIKGINTTLKYRFEIKSESCKPKEADRIFTEAIDSLEQYVGGGMMVSVVSPNDIRSGQDEIFTRIVIQDIGDSNIVSVVISHRISDAIKRLTGINAVDVCKRDTEYKMAFIRTVIRLRGCILSDIKAEMAFDIQSLEDKIRLLKVKHNGLF